MVEQTEMKIEDGGEDNLGRGTMVTALCWVSRGYAKPILQEADFEEEEAQVK